MINSRKKGSRMERPREERKRRGSVGNLYE